MNSEQLNLLTSWNNSLVIFLICDTKLHMSSQQYLNGASLSLYLHAHVFFQATNKYVAHHSYSGAYAHCTCVASAMLKIDHLYQLLVHVADVSCPQGHANMLSMFIKQEKVELYLGELQAGHPDFNTWEITKANL